MHDHGCTPASRSVGLREPVHVSTRLIRIVFRYFLGDCATLDREKDILLVSNGPKNIQLCCLLLFRALRLEAQMLAKLHERFFEFIGAEFAKCEVLQNCIDPNDKGVASLVVLKQEVVGELRLVHAIRVDLFVRNACERFRDTFVAISSRSQAGLARNLVGSMKRRRSLFHEPTLYGVFLRAVSRCLKKLSGLCVFSSTKCFVCLPL